MKNEKNEKNEMRGIRVMSKKKEVTKRSEK